jgi:arsenate reductase
MLKVYTYQGCSTCRKATQWLRGRGVAFAERAIRETPPTLGELGAMLRGQGGDRRAVFNTSGLDYRALGLKDTLSGLSEEEALRLLAGNGNLVKRPFAIDAEGGVYLVGFREDAWERALG